MKFEVGKTYHIISREKADLLVKAGMINGKYPKYTKAGCTDYVDYSMLGQSVSCSSWTGIYHSGEKYIMLVSVGQYSRASVHDWMCAEYYSAGAPLMETE